MKIVFFVNSMSQQRCYKRIREFISHGYSVKAYGVKREGQNVPIIDGAKVEEFVSINDDMSYAQRLMLIRRNLKHIIKQHNNSQTIFYCFQLDMALAVRSLTRHQFIYEESDLSHTYINNLPIRYTLELLDKAIIRKSLLTIFTSEGFANYHFGKEKVKNMLVVPNKLDATITSFKYEPSEVDLNHLRFAFVGVVRHKVTYNFAKVLAQHFPQHQFHLYGNVRPVWKEQLRGQQFDNLIIHHTFKNPDELPSIYENIDILYAPSDNNTNGRYSEVNKLYEGIYFRKPILANSGTYTAKKIEQMKIGFVVDMNNENEIIKFVKSLSADSIEQVKLNLEQIPKEFAINNNYELFHQLEKLIIKI